MKIFIFLYLLPAIIVTLLLPQFIKYQGGIDYLRALDTWDESWNDYAGYVIDAVAFVPFTNIIFAFTLIVWVCMRN